MHPIFVVVLTACAGWFFAVAAMAGKGLGIRIGFAALGVAVFFLTFGVTEHIMKDQPFFHRALRSGPDIVPIMTYIVVPTLGVCFLAGLLLKLTVVRRARTVMGDGDQRRSPETAVFSDVEGYGRAVRAIRLVAAVFVIQLWLVMLQGSLSVLRLEEGSRLSEAIDTLQFVTEGFITATSCVVLLGLRRLAGGMTGMPGSRWAKTTVITWLAFCFLEVFYWVRDCAWRWDSGLRWSMPDILEHVIGWSTISLNIATFGLLSIVVRGLSARIHRPLSLLLTGGMWMGILVLLAKFIVHASSGNQLQDHPWLWWWVWVVLPPTVLIVFTVVCLSNITRAATVSGTRT